MPSLVEKLKKQRIERQNNASPLEVWVRQFLIQYNLGHYETEYPVGKYWIDIAFPEKGIAVELDGVTFHKDRKQKDDEKDKFLIEIGWRVYRIPSTECWNPIKISHHMNFVRKLLGERLVEKQGRKIISEYQYCYRCEICHEMYFVQSNECFKAYAKMNGLNIFCYPKKESGFQSFNDLKLETFERLCT